MVLLKIIINFEKGLLNKENGHVFEPINFLINLKILISLNRINVFEYYRHNYTRMHLKVL